MTCNNTWDYYCTSELRKYKSSWKIIWNNKLILVYQILFYAGKNLTLEYFWKGPVSMFLQMFLQCFFVDNIYLHLLLEQCKNICLTLKKKIKYFCCVLFFPSWYLQRRNRLKRRKTLQSLKYMFIWSTVNATASHFLRILPLKQTNLFK